LSLLLHLFERFVRIGGSFGDVDRKCADQIFEVDNGRVELSILAFECGMGKVYKAQDKKINEMVALKHRLISIIFPSIHKAQIPDMKNIPL
jgi:hypothetical protein